MSKTNKEDVNKPTSNNFAWVCGTIIALALVVAVGIKHTDSIKEVPVAEVIQLKPKPRPTPIVETPKEGCICKENILFFIYTPSKPKTNYLETFLDTRAKIGYID